MVILMAKNVTVTLYNWCGKKEIKMIATMQCGACKFMIDSYKCEFYRCRLDEGYKDWIPDKYRLGEEACPHFIQAEDDNGPL